MTTATETLQINAVESRKRLNRLNELRQKPQNALTAKLLECRELRDHSAHLKARYDRTEDVETRKTIKKEMDVLDSQLRGLQRECADLEGEIKIIDSEMGTCHASILEAQRVEDEEELRSLRACASTAMDSARAEVASFFVAASQYATKYSEGANGFSRHLCEEFYEHERTLRIAGWKEIDPIATPVRRIDFAVMLPPPNKS